MGNVDATLGRLAHGQRRSRHERERVWAMLCHPWKVDCGGVLMGEGEGVTVDTTLENFLMARDDGSMRGRRVWACQEMPPLEDWLVAREDGNMSVKGYGQC